jgi:hypothetical protein
VEASGPVVAIIDGMTQLEVLYRYEQHPTEATMVALGNAREVYGIRRMQIDPEWKTIRVEYDATRLNKQIVYQLLRRSGLDLVEEMPLIPPQPLAETAAVAPPAAK